ncbi:hypothetical protein IJT10_04685 [bacterium]|nr:hypothetical protein [bacterium]
MVVKRLQDLAKYISGKLLNEEFNDLEISDITGIDAVNCGHNLSNTITFADNLEVYQKAKELGFVAIVISNKLTEIEQTFPTISVDNPRVAFAQLLDLFYPRRRYEAQIHPRAIVDPTAAISPTAYIGPYAIIEKDAHIGDHCEIHAHAQVGSNSHIGAETRLLAGAHIKKDCQIGRKCLIGALTNIGPKTTIGDNVEIGARCQIDTCQIGTGARLDNLINIKEGVNIAPLAIVISQACLRENSQTGNLSIVAGQNLLQPEAKVGDFATVAARSLVEGDIPAGQNTWSGEPAIMHKAYMRKIAQRSLPLKYWQKIRKKAE